MNLRVILSLVLAAGISTAVAAEEELKPVTLKHLENYQAEALEMNKSKLPMLLTFVADYCPYCETVKEEFLKPMLRSGDYGDRVVMRQLDITSGEEIVLVNGKKQYASDFAEEHKVIVTPTVLFLDAEGKELNERLVGITTVDYYGGFLDEGINASLEALGNPIRTVP